MAFNLENKTLIIFINGYMKGKQICERRLLSICTYFRDCTVQYSICRYMKTKL